MAPHLAKELGKPEDCLYRCTLSEMVKPEIPAFQVPARALEIIFALRARLAIHGIPGDADLFALASELEFWLEVTF